MAIDLDELERLAKAATQGRWTITLKPDPDYPGVQIYDLCTGGHFSGQLDTHFPGDPEAHYITDACNSLPELIAENRALRERVRELERQREYLAFELSTDDDQADCNHTHLSCEHRKGWLCKAGMKGQMQCWISEAEKAAKEGVE